MAEGRDIFAGVIQGPPSNLLALGLPEYFEETNTPHGTGAHFLYSGLIYAEETGRSDEYIRALIEKNESWYSLLLEYLAQTYNDDKASAIMGRFGAPARMSDALRDAFNKTRPDCSTYIEDAKNPTIFQCSSLSRPYVGLFTLKYNVIVIVGDSYDKGTLSGASDYCTELQRGPSPNCFFTVLPFTEVQHLPDFQGVTPGDLPMWQMTAYGVKYAEGKGIPTKEQIKDLYEGMQHKNTSYAWRQTSFGKDNKIKLFVRPFISQRTLNAFIKELKNQVGGEEMFSRLCQAVGDLEIYLVPYDQSYEGDLSSQTIETIGAIYDIDAKRYFKDLSGVYRSTHHSMFAPLLVSNSPDMTFLHTTFIHEWMHALHYSLIPFGAGSIPWLEAYYEEKERLHPYIKPTDDHPDPNPDWPTNDAGKAAGEFLAESFVSYLTRDSRLKRTDPFIYEVADRFFSSPDWDPKLLCNVDDLAEKNSITLPKFVNVGWQGNVNVGGYGEKFKTGAGFGWGSEFVTGLRFRADLGVTTDLTENITLAATPEIDAAITRMIMLSITGTFGAEYDDLLYGGTAGLKANLLFPSLGWGAELDAGLALMNGLDVAPFIKMQTRF